jgi:hypothetical protein
MPHCVGAHDADDPQQGREQDQQQRDPVDAEDVVDVERRDPVEVFDELEAVVLAAHGRRVIGEP